MSDLIIVQDEEGNIIDFLGADQYIDIPDDITLSVGVRHSSFQELDQRIIERNNSDSC